MDNKKMGQFILELRKSKQMTQKDLADKLNITDKAVSKWERGLSSPDISLISAISNILDVSTNELLNGEKSSSAGDESSREDIEDCVDKALNYADKAVKNRFRSLRGISAIVFTTLLLVGSFVCVICDLAISGTFTWSLFPLSSILFTWLILIPVIRFGKKGIVWTLVMLSVLIIPFLYVLDYLITGSDMILPIGGRMAAISMVYIWIIYSVFKIWKKRKLFAAGISTLTAIPVWLFMNYCLSRMIAESVIDIWDMMGFAIVAVAAAVLLVLDMGTKKNIR